MDLKVKKRDPPIYITPTPDRNQVDTHSWHLSVPCQDSEFKSSLTLTNSFNQVTIETAILFQACKSLRKNGEPETKI